MKRRRVWIDASYHEGHAGLAIVGAMGEHTQCIPAPDNNYAEIAALDWAIRLAAQERLDDLRFLTDSSAALAKFAYLNTKRDTIVGLVPRKHNKGADKAARGARLSLCPI